MKPLVLTDLMRKGIRLFMLGHACRRCSVCRMGFRRLPVGVRVHATKGKEADLE